MNDFHINVPREPHVRWGTVMKISRIETHSGNKRCVLNPWMVLQPRLM